MTPVDLTQPRRRSAFDGSLNAFAMGTCGATIGQAIMGGPGRPLVAIAIGLVIMMGHVAGRL